jgi:HEPN domain-containing protein
MNRFDFQQLAQIRIAEAQKLLEAGMPEGAYYLAGYAVECALKACIAKNVKQFDFPPPKREIETYYTHNIEKLVEAAKLKSVLLKDSDSNPSLEANWQIVICWSEQGRYEINKANEAKTLIEAITNPSNGILTWVKKYW